MSSQNFEIRMKIIWKLQKEEKEKKRLNRLENEVKETYNIGIW